MRDLLDGWLARAERLPPQPRFQEWWRALGQVDFAGLGTAHRAVAGGVLADRLAWVFAAGYQAALNDVRGDPDRVGGLAVGEPEGAGRTRLRSTGEGHVLAGEKRSVALCNHVQWLLVEAVDEDDREVLVQLEATGPGVVVVPGGRQDYLPELDRGALLLLDAPCTDGAVRRDHVVDVIERFRLDEALHVMRAGLGYLLRRAGGVPRSDAVRGELLRLLLLLQQRRDDPSDWTELSIRAERLLDDVPHWAGSDPESSWLEDFRANRAVFGFASARFRGWIAR